MAEVTGDIQGKKEGTEVTEPEAPPSPVMERVELAENLADQEMAEKYFKWTSKLKTGIDFLQ